jgi:phosphohistidine phosphatase
LSEKFPTSCAALFQAAEERAFYPPAFQLTGVLRAKDFREAEAS